MDNVLAPDFSSVVTESKILPGGNRDKIHTSFRDDILSGYSAVILNDSKTDDYELEEGLDSGKRLLTFIVRFPRCVLAEVNTHRVFSRNSASSRARSFRVTIAEIMEDPYIPLFTKNQRGMGGRYLTENERDLAVEEWLIARDQAVASVLRLLLAGSESVGEEKLAPSSIRENHLELINVYDELYKNEDTSILSPHKQNVNRLLEPFMWHEAIISSTYWDNFFTLRDHDDAQPEIKAIARLMKEAIDASTPKSVSLHTPFKDDMVTDSGHKSTEELWGIIRSLFMDSAGDCARVSYKSKLETGASKSEKLGERLLRDGHLSPFEHAAINRKYLMEYAELLGIEEDSLPRSNFSQNWVQFRSLLESGIISN